MKVIAFPPSLVPGDSIAVVAPASSFPRDEVFRGLAWLGLRYRVRMGPGLFARDAYLAGSDARRLDELSRALADDDVKAIVAARGGYGAMRLLDAVPWHLLVRVPKWIVGFSDVTAIHAVAWACGVASIHGPNVTGLGRASPHVREAWLACLERPSFPRAWPALRVIRAGEARGPIVGGNLSLVHAMSAAGRLQIPKGAVIALEDVTEAPYRVDRMLTSLRLAGVFAQVSAVVFGAFTRCSPGDDGRSVEAVLDERTADLGIPVLAGAPFGHEANNEAFVLGRVARIRGDTVAFE